MSPVHFLQLFATSLSSFFLLLYSLEYLVFIIMMIFINLYSVTDSIADRTISSTICNDYKFKFISLEIFPLKITEFPDNELPLFQVFFPHGRGGLGSR